MSRFFAADSSSSSEDELIKQPSGNRFGTFYDSETESDKDMSEDFSQQSSADEGSSEELESDHDDEAAKRNRFLFGSDSEEEEDEEEHRQVKSSKEKAEEEFESLCDAISYSVDTDEWQTVQAGMINI